VRLGPLILFFFVSAVGARENSGYAQLKGSAFLKQSETQESDAQGWGTLYTKSEDRLGEAQLTGALRAEYISSDIQGPVFFDPLDRRVRRAPLALPEFWLRVPLTDSWDLQVGRFQLGWGKTDGHSPADMFLPRDLTNPFGDEKLPIWAVRLSGEKAVLRYEVVVSPVTTPWRIPALGTRQAPLLSRDIPKGTIFNELESPIPDGGFSALRLLATIDDWDLGVWGRAGVRPAPILNFRSDLAYLSPSGLVIPVERRYAREEAVGVEASRLVGAWVMRGEVAASYSGDHELGDALIASVSGEKRFGDSTLLLTLADNARKTPVDPVLLFDRSILPALISAWNRTEEWGEWKLVFTLGLNRGDGHLKGEVGYNLNDVWKLTGGAELPFGSERGPFGGLAQNRQVAATLRRSW